MSKNIRNVVKNVTKAMQKSNINTTLVKKNLPHGAVKEIAKRSKRSTMTVYRVINKGVNNPIVLKALRDYIEEIQLVEDQINTLVGDSKLAC